MRVGIIGCGSIGARHARNAATMGHYLLLSDTDRERIDALEIELSGAFGERWALPTLPSHLDAVLICTPAHTHAAVARELLAAGYRGPLFVEKPLAMSVEECDVFETWPHRTTMVGYNLRHHYMARAMRAMFRHPLCGSFQIASDMRCWHGTYGEPIAEYSHEIDLALWFGAPSIVNHAEIHADRAFLTLGEWDVSLRWHGSTYSRQWSVSARSMGYQHAFASPEELGNDMYIEEVKHFLDCAQRGAWTETPFEDGKRVLDIIAQATRLSAVRA